MIDPRKRALEALALGGAVPSTDEVDVSTVPTYLPPTEYPTADLDGGPRPVPQALTTGDPQGSTERDYYADALAQKHQRQFEQSLSGIGSGILQAFTGVGPSQETLRQRREYEEEPLVTYLQKQKEADRAREMEIQQARLQPKPGQRMKSTDPNSPESKRAQMLVRATLGDKFAEEEIAQITEADADAALKYGSLSGQREVAREGQAGAQKRFEAQYQQRAELAARQEGLDWARLSQQEQLARMRLEEAKATREAAGEARTEGQATDFGKTLAGSGIPSAKAKIGELNVLFKKYPKDLPGIGFLSGAIPNRLESTDAKRVRMLIGQLGAEYQKSMTGAGASDAERARYDEVTGLLKRGDSESVRLGVQMMAEDLGVKEAAIEQSFPPEAVEKVRSRGKPTTAPQRKPASTVLPKDASGQPTLDKTKPAKVQYSPSRDMTREIDAAGNVIREYKGRPNG